MVSASTNSSWSSRPCRWVLWLWVPVLSAWSLLEAHVLARLAQSNPPALPAEIAEDQPQEIWHLRYATGAAPGFFAVTTSNAGQLIAARDRENRVTVFDVAEKIKRFEFSGHDTNWIETIQFSPDDRFLLTAAGSGEELKIWRTDNGSLELEIPTTTSIAAFSKRGDLIAALGSTHIEYFLWPGGISKANARWQLKDETAIAMSDDGNLIVMTHPPRNVLNPQIQLVELFNRVSKLRIALPGEKSRPERIMISPNNQWIAGFFRDSNRIHLWSSADPTNGHHLLDGHAGLLTALAFSRDSRFLLSADDQQKLFVWDMLTRQPVHGFETGQTSIRAVTFFSRPFQVAVSGASGKESSIWVGDLRPIILKSDGLKPENLDSIWRLLSSADCKRSLQATNWLIQNFDQFYADLAKTVADATYDQSLTSLDFLIHELSHPRYEKRELATRLLAERLSRFEKRLREAYQDPSLTLETRYRIRRILRDRKLQPRLDVNVTRRWLRLILACEIKASAESKQLLQRISCHHDFRISSAALEALERVTGSTR